MGLGGEEEGEGEGGRSARMMHCMHIPDSLVARVPNMNQVRMFNIAAERGLSSECV